MEIAPLVAPATLLALMGWKVRPDDNIAGTLMLVAGAVIIAVGIFLILVVR